ncbi:MAG: alpha/beta hydrolase [Candidatus Schekmanbacteria bacterium]|nr:alpha/beta hydrolase [Candidatus Schekmanbacteria bacterium]
MISMYSRMDSADAYVDPTFEPPYDDALDEEQDFFRADESTILDRDEYEDEYESAEDSTWADTYGLAGGDVFSESYGAEDRGYVDSFEARIDEAIDEAIDSTDWEQDLLDEGEKYAAEELNEWLGEPWSESSSVDDPDGLTMEDVYQEDEQFQPLTRLRLDTKITPDQLMNAEISGKDKDKGEALEKLLVAERGGYGVAMPYVVPKKKTDVEPTTPRPPAILVHGIDGSPSSINKLATELYESGHQPYIYFYDDRNRNLTDSGRDLAQAVEEIRAAHGMSTADGQMTIVAHSMGGLVGLSAMRQMSEFGWGQEGRTDPRLTLAAVDTPWRAYGQGSELVKQFTGDDSSLPDMIADSEFQRDVHQGPLPANMEVRLVEANNARRWEWSRKVVGFEELSHSEINEVLGAALLSEDSATFNEDAVSSINIRNMVGTLNLLPEDQRIDMIRDLTEVHLEAAPMRRTLKLEYWKQAKYQEIMARHINIVAGTHDDILDTDSTAAYVRMIARGNRGRNTGSTTTAR